ncbi:DUF3237 domain-containing protein [Comamonas thiooxydans]|uniref:DUF3237 domain-containing protein n=1 Tax=Comamonas thiooxydans TaxID=363952 RepID=UPI001CC97CAA|nr:DUF3237 domain-containing protein [Comamonas thiooxydans]MCO8247896.1 DUF3237 domain-containing protein [Comamonas thiooxydans]UBQ41295.1 DUF3237 domain-containing protein [Comamonas thiooxydans]
MTFPGSDFQIAAPQLRRFADFEVQVSAVQEVGATARGFRRVIPIVGGQVRGDGWSARVLPGGADFQLLVSEEVAELDARYVIETDGGDLIYVSNQALRTGPAELMQRLRRGETVDPSAIYFRCAPRFETASKRFAWLGQRLFVGAGARFPEQVVMRFFEVL